MNIWLYNMVLVTNIRVQIIAAAVRIEVVFGRVSCLPYILCRRDEKGWTDYILGIHISIGTYNNNNNNNVHTHIEWHLRTMFRRRVQAGRHITLFYDIIIQRVSTLYLLRIIYNSWQRAVVPIGYNVMLTRRSRREITTYLYIPTTGILLYFAPTIHAIMLRRTCEQNKFLYHSSWTRV